MLVKDSHTNVNTFVDGVKGTMRIFIYHPYVPGYPEARFPGVILFSEIYQVTGPVARFARKIAGHGYIVLAPSIFHEFVGPEPLPYDAEGTAAGNDYKVKKSMMAYDQDADLCMRYLDRYEYCTGRIGVTGMCLGGHLALRCALNPGVSAAVTFFATDLHTRSLTGEDYDHTIDRLREMRAELACIHGALDDHVPPEGRDLIRKKLRDSRANFSWYEIAYAQHAFTRDESSKGRYDAAITKVSFEILLELFERTLKLDLGYPEIKPEEYDYYDEEGHRVDANRNRLDKDDKIINPESKDEGKDTELKNEEPESVDTKKEVRINDVDLKDAETKDEKIKEIDEQPRETDIKE